MLWYGDWWGFGPWFIFPILMPIVMLVIVVVMLSVFRGVPWGPFGRRDGPERGNEGGGDTALEILQRRFASGEITEQEYEEKRELLRR